MARGILGAMKYIELFAGIGGFRYGLENVTAPKGKQSRISKESKTLASNKHISLGTQQFTCVYANEWDKYASQIYRRHYGEIDTRDIRDVSEFPDFDLLTAGFPCQAFSVAGKRLGFKDTRGTLFFEIARILKSKRPRHLLLENVKGLLSHEQGQTFNTILGVLSDLGYRVEWMVLNSKHFGVPQNRERVFIIGHLREECSGEVFPVRQQNTENVCKSPSEQERRSWVSTIDSRYGERWASETYVRTNQQNTRPEGSKPDNSNGIQRTSYSDDMRIRRLTPVEGERLQGFPDRWTEGVSDTQRYKCLGNAVTTTVITAIGTELYKHLQEE